MDTHATHSPRLPAAFVWTVLVICGAPFLLNLLGVDFGTTKVAFPFATAENMGPVERIDGMFHTLAGSFTHTILEWTAFCTAIFTVALAFLHFTIKRDVTTPIIGVALFCAGAMDAFHTLAADRLIEAVADNRNLIPFTWAISRVFNALIMVVGISLFLFGKQRALKGNLRFVVGISAIFGMAAFLIIEYCANTAQLPQTMYPDSLITRPYDVLPLIIFILSGLTLYRWFYQRQPGLFTHALLVSVIPEVAVELHMAFGSTSLFDNHFNIAHFLKIFAYLVPLGGLALDYLHTYEELATEVQDRMQAERRFSVHYNISCVLAETSTLEEASPMILQSVCKELEWSFGAWWQIVDEFGQLRCIETWQADPFRMQDFTTRTCETTFSCGVGFPGRIWATGRSAWIPNVADDPNFSRALAAQKVGLNRGRGFPVVFQGKIFGIMEFFSESQRDTDESLLPVLDSLGSQIGQFAERRRMDVIQHEEAAEFESQMTAINKAQATIEFTLDGTVLTANENFLWMMDYALEEIQGQHHRMFCEPNYAESPEYQAFWAKLNRGEYDSGVYRRVGKEGKEVWIQATYNPIVNGQGKLYKVVKFATDITSQKILEEALKVRECELVEARDKAYEAVKIKAAFLATMSHEIRTPMNGVLGMTGILLDSNLDQDQRECAETVKHSAESLLTIINDILDFSKIESGKLEIEIIDFDLRVAVDELLDLLGAKAQDKGLELVGLIYASVPTAVKGDPGRVRQILLNLVDNAIKFTDQGEVVVQIVPDRETAEEIVLRVEVRDTGIGLTPKAQDRLFQPFSQADGSTTRKFGGTGLGLAISKQLVELMGGEIGVESSLGHGSCFWFTVRLEKQSQPTERDVETGYSLEGLRVCVVDENDTNRLLLTHYTTAWGMDCLNANNGSLALALLHDAVAHGQPCDLLIMDMHMPMMNGVELARQVKADPVLADTRLVMLTSMGQRGDAALVQEAGIAAYLTKPIHQYQLQDCLLMVMNPSEMNTAQFVTKHTLLEAAQRREGRLLVADDNMVNQKVAVRMLERLGYRVDVVANGLEAVEAVSRIPYHAVLMDCQMPEMDGYEATREIRRREALSVRRDQNDSDSSHISQVKGHPSRITPHLPVIAMTANAMQGDREKCLESGMDDFLSKPVKPEELEAVLERWLPTRERSLIARDPYRENHEIHHTHDTQPETHNETQDPPLDAATLDGLKELGGDDPSFLIEVIQQFLQDGPAHVAAIRHAVVDDDADALMKAAHALKGSCRNMGALSLGELCLTLEHQGQTGQAGDLEDVLTQLESAYSRTQRALEAELARLPVVPI